MSAIEPCPPSSSWFTAPSVGPLTGAPVAAELRRAGREVVVPSLLYVARGATPFWHAVADAVTACIPSDGQLIIC